MREEAIYTEEYHGHKIEIFPDYDSPDTPNDWNDGVVLVHYHRYFYVDSKIVSEDDIREWYQGEKIDQEKYFYIFPVSALIHSGIWLSLEKSFSADSCGWDTSHVGAILVKKEEAKDEKDAFRIASGTIETWNDILSGNVYGFVIDGDGDSVWGCIGDYEDGALAEARESVDAINPEEFAREQTRKKLDALKMWEMGLTGKERDAVARSVKSIEKQLSILAGNK